MTWANSQPIWIQVVIGLVVFFVVLPLIISLILNFFVGIAELLRRTSKVECEEKTFLEGITTFEGEQISDELFAQAFCESFNKRKSIYEIKEYLSVALSTSNEKIIYLKNNPELLEIIKKLRK